MRFLGLMIACWCVLANAACAQNAPAPAAAPATPGAAAPAAATAPAIDAKNANSIGSYGIGANIGRSLKSDGMELNVEAFVQGLQDGLKGKEPRYTEAQLRAALKIIQGELQAKKEKLEQSMGEKNKAEGEKFLAANKAKEGVVTRKSGLQYQVISSGKGPSPKATDTVKVHYEGTLLDGTVFDSSIKRKEPAEFPVDRVIPGWTEALQLMKVGDHWKLFVPANLAYGARGAGDVIGPNAVLTFDVELLSIEPPAKSEIEPPAKSQIEPPTK